jgi:hypothetical protein
VTSWQVVRGIKSSINTFVYKNSLFSKKYMVHHRRIVKIFLLIIYFILLILLRRFPFFPFNYLLIFGLPFLILYAMLHIKKWTYCARLGLPKLFNSCGITDKYDKGKFVPSSAVKACGDEGTASPTLNLVSRWKWVVATRSNRKISWPCLEPNIMSWQPYRIVNSFLPNESVILKAKILSYYLWQIEIGSF